MNDYYEAAHYPGMATMFSAIVDGKRQDICSWMTVCQCRSYARAGGFTKEVVKTVDGIRVFEFHKETA